MHVRAIEVQGFMRYSDRQRVELPERGVVVVTGGNGQGKSALLDAVAYARNGRTLRGTPAPHNGGACEVVLVSDVAEIRRARTAGGKNKLAWNKPGEPPVEYESAAQADTALARALVYADDVWEAACVFATADASRFTSSTDADRKRLVEMLVGVARFDAALDLCRKDLRVVDAKAAKAAQAAAVAEATLDGARRRIADAQAALTAGAGDGAVSADDAADGPPFDESAAQKRLVELRAQVVAVGQEIRTLRAAGEETRGDMRELRVRLEEARKRARLVDLATCPTCEQPIPPALCERLRDDVAQAAGKALVAEQQASDRAEADAAVASELEDEERALREAVTGQAGEIASAAERRREVARAAAERARREQMREQARRTLAAAELALAEASEALDDAKDAHAGHAAEVAVLGAVEQVLGLRGVRAQVVARALVGIEECANAWLARIALLDGGERPVTLKLSATSETARGATLERIGLELLGAGGGHGYKAASGGERRRIDVGVMLGLSEVAAGAHGMAQGTMFFDEVFDALDDAGVDAVGEAVGDLSSDRAVVVITHSPALVSRLPNVRAHWHVEKGRVGQG